MKCPHCKKGKLIGIVPVSEYFELNKKEGKISVGRQIKSATPDLVVTEIVCDQCNFSVCGNDYQSAIDVLEEDLT